ncbi:sigma-70 family RNA polymerase sigma factor [Solirubrobacter phytolaccae]|uniref:Sigma-70 family RNA polymerase sigma factor n=1 Tax=Solirubrobacter phytolaccae TaxID=1404360 RepID=A0A9X3NC32_9ACTN|nr:sigma-70 family RNA polymerase sigma factor [Solirubrobacter phytolaccae]MDA0183374.1 sigma-70 family RNA polymerase sigma factor [Solirubrobacter phytolaccae]
MDPFDRMYLRYRDPVLGYFARRVGEPEVAADLMAETFARALVHFRTRPPDDPASWLFSIARNLLIDSARRGQVEQSARRRLRLDPLVLDDVDIQRIEEVAEAADLAETVREALSASEYEALRGRAVDEESYAELALRLRCSEAVARKRVSRAIANVRTMMRDGHE